MAQTFNSSLRTKCCWSPRILQKYGYQSDDQCNIEKHHFAQKKALQSLYEHRTCLYRAICNSRMGRENFLVKKRDICQNNEKDDTYVSKMRRSYASGILTFWQRIPYDRSSSLCSVAISKPGFLTCSDSIFKDYIRNFVAHSNPIKFPFLQENIRTYSQFHVHGF